MADIYYPAITGDSFMDEKVLDAFDKVDKMEKAIHKCEKEFENTEPKIDRSVCDMLSTVNKWTDIAGDLANVVSSASGTIQVFNGFENCIAMQLILKRLQLCLLYVKRIVLKIKIKVAEFTKKMVEAMINGNGSIVPDPISISVNAVFSALGLIVNALLMVIETFLKMIAIGPLGLDAQSIVFFITPKSLSKTKAPAYNPNMAVADRLPNVIKMTLHEIEKSVEKINNAIKVAAIATGAAMGAAAILANNPNFGVSKILNKVKPGTLQKQIENILDFLPIPMGMPKYEKLKFTNLGFMAYLITGFEPAAHKSFGIPGQF
jgi:hypothetical protein